MNMYELIYDPINNKVLYVKRLSDNAFIPFDADNTDYQKYLEWLADGNIPKTSGEE